MQILFFLSLICAIKGWVRGCDGGIVFLIIFNIFDIILLLYLLNAGLLNAPPAVLAKS